MLLTLLLAVEIRAEDTATTPSPVKLDDATKDVKYEAALRTDLTDNVTWSVKAQQPGVSGPDVKQGLPDGITLDASGKLTGTPTVAGTWQFALTAKDKANQEKDYLYQLTVKEAKADPPADVAPVITTADVPKGKVGTAYSAALAATGTPDLNWKITSGTLPAGLTLADHTIAGTPTEDGTFTFTVEVSNNASNDSKEFTLVIDPAAAAPVITTETLPDGTVGTAYDAELKATGTPDITWGVKDGTKLPDGIKLNGNRLTGTPEKAGEFNFTLTAANSAGTVQKAFTINIDAAEVKPSITTETLPDGMVGSAYSADLKAEGTAPVAWKLKDGTKLPDGLTLDSSGRLSGTPQKAGTFPFTLTASNTAGDDSKDYSITIAEAPVKPAITTASLPDATAGKAYSAELKADGTAPITWTAKDTAALPEGITVNGNKLAGTPAKAGTYKFTLVAENEAGTAEKAFTLVVKEPEKQPEKKYDVTVVNDGNGTASADITSAAAGTKITLTAKPKDGWHFKEWKLVQGTVTIKNNTFTMPKENVTVKAMFEKDKFEYKVTKGGGQTHRIGDGKALTFTCNGELKDLTGIYVDNSLVNSSYYTLKSGSTVLTLKADYLDKLKAGTHTLKFKYGDNYAETTFKVTAKAAAKTGDSTSVQIWLFTLGIALIAAAVVIISKRRRTR